jgi:hypothetical protein
LTEQPSRISSATMLAAPGLGVTFIKVIQGEGAFCQPNPFQGQGAFC